MKRTALRKRTKKRLKRSQLSRKQRLEYRGGSLFPGKRHPKFMAWMKEKTCEAAPCDGCGRWRCRHRAHLIPKGRGGKDIGNVVMLCVFCHTAQEKRTDAFCTERGVDLYAIAAAYADEYHRTEGASA